MRIVFASHNAGKIRELRHILQPFNLHIIPQAELGVSEIEETGITFIENAILKARHACRTTGLPAIADDSGLEVDALKGAPGIYSARYASEKASSAANITKLLSELADIPPEQRKARFYCILVYMAHANDPVPLICEGSWEGVILQQPLGIDGFGYDPVFWDFKENKSAAQLSPEKKNQLSHRGQALRALVARLHHKCLL
jgi:XTP/dITP diphosphohydrolase